MGTTLCLTRVRRPYTVVRFGRMCVDLLNPIMRSKRTMPKTIGIGIIITIISSIFRAAKPNKKTIYYIHPERAISLSNHVVRSQTFR